MDNSTPKTYWRSVADRDGQPESDHSDVHLIGPAEFSRRRFLEATGFTLSLAAMSGCGRAPVETALPFAVQPEGVIPGRMRAYASTCGGCSAACGLLAGVRDGRPLKMEGMPEHPLSRGGLCAIGQALPLGLYDSHRLRGPLQNGEETTWEQVDAAIASQLETVRTQGGSVRVVTPSITSPTLQATIDEFLESFDDARHVVFDTLSCSAILDAHQKTHGARVLPHFRLDQCRMIVALGADFLGTWISPVEFAAAWRSRRSPTPDSPEMSYHVQLEGRMSLTGSKADQRMRVAPSEYGVVLSHLAQRICDLAKVPAPQGTLGDSPLDDGTLAELAQGLWAAQGESALLCDHQDVSVQMLVNFINQTLGNYGSTVDIDRPSRQKQGDDTEVIALFNELKGGTVSVLITAGVDLLHNLPGDDALTDSIDEVSLTISLAERVDEFAAHAQFVCPDHHSLESWGDSEPVSGVLSLSQPTIAPLRDTRSVLESLARWSGRDEAAYDILRTSWRNRVLPRAEQQPFERFWDQSLHDGFVEVEPESPSISAFQGDVVGFVDAPQTASDLELVLYSKVGLTDSRHAHNPWLQELPDPISKVAWDNYACVSPLLAQELGISDGDVVRVATERAQLELPALVQPGQHDRVVSIALAYGVRGTERFTNIGPEWIESRPTVEPGKRVGQNASELAAISDGALSTTRSDIKLTKTGQRHELACTQLHHSLEVPPNVAPHGAEVRHIVQETTLAEFLNDPAAGTPEMHHFGDQQLWAEDHPKTGHSWGMVIDLNACTGCSACLIACQSENNVPVVGKDEVRRQREMHWIRLDRYYSGDGDDVDVAHQPMMCHHCDNAPCETVCPVLATVHSEEGLNEQAYNRCVGTRYCANNCPYKVRRFNWFKYPFDDPLQNLALNPDVMVRGRGVMEKCSMCVQRIEDGKLEANRLGVPLVDGEIQTACQQSCPAQAIAFGDMNDASSRVHAALEDPRRYGVLEEFNFRPSVAYLRVVRNRAAEPAHESEQGGHHV